MSPVATEFSLRMRIKQIMAASLVADPKQIAEEVLGTISTGEAVAALTECLPDFVRIIVHSERQRTPATKGPAKSWKTEGAKAYAEKLLRQRVDISGNGTGWKFLAECDEDDCISVAEKRRQQATDLEDMAAWFEKVAATLAEHKAATVAELPESVLAALATNREVQS